MDATTIPLPGEPMPPTPGFRLFSLPVLSWAFYDFANTIFSFAVITLYFNEWVIEDHGRPDWHVGLMSLVVSLCLVLVMPAMGAISDHFGRRLPFLGVFTLGCVGSTVVLGTIDSITTALVVAGIAIFCFQLALSMYDPLLASVAPESHRGAVSGLGVGLGYVGVLLGSQVLSTIVGDGDKQDAFIPTAMMFLLLSIPTFLFVKEKSGPRASDAPSLAMVAHHSLAQIVFTVITIARHHRPAGRFLIARFLYVDAVATVIAYMTVYMNRVGDFSAGDKTLVLGLAMVAAALGGFVGGRIVERRGPLYVLRGILVLATASLLLAAVTGSSALVWVLAPAVGLTLGAVWTSDRVFMLRLTPPAHRGEFFAVYNLVGKLSAGIGPLVLWGGTIKLLHDNGSWSVLDASRMALGMLALAVVAGLWVLRPLTDEVRFRDDEWVEEAA